MASFAVHLDLNLCREIMRRTMEVLTSDQPKGPDNYTFDGYDPSIVEFNLRKLHDNEFIGVRQRTEQRQGTINVWPQYLYERGARFLELAKDDNIWETMLERFEEQRTTPTLKRMMRVLMQLETELESVGWG